jgi:chromosome segregation ATPase
LDRRGSSRIAHERQQTEEEIQVLHQTIEGLQVQLTEETKKYERMHRDRNVSVKNLADAEKGARRQVDELTARDATIARLRDQLDRITAESNKKSTKIEDLQRALNRARPGYKGAQDMPRRRSHLSPVLTSR